MSSELAAERGRGSLNETMIFLDVGAEAPLKVKAKSVVSRIWCLLPAAVTHCRAEGPVPTQPQSPKWTLGCSPASLR